MFPILSCNERSRSRSTGALILACACSCLAFGVSIPLFLGNQFEGDVRRAETDRYGARDELDRTRAIAFAEAERARSELAAAADRLARFDASLLPTAARAAAGENAITGQATVLRENR